MQQSFMKTRPVLPLVLSMSLPMVLSMMVTSLYNIVDSYYVARISEDAMTALSLVFPVQNLINAVTIGFSIGANAVISYPLGAQEEKKANAAATQSLVCNTLHGVLLTVGCIAVMPGFLQLFTTDAQVVDMGVRYSRVAFAFSVFVAASMSMEKIFQAVGRMMLTMICMMSGCVANIILDPVLIFGLGPFPEMGIEGAALATGIGQTLSLVIYVICYLQGRLPVRLCFDPRTLNYLHERYPSVRLSYLVEDSVASFEEMMSRLDFTPQEAIVLLVGMLSAFIVSMLSIQFLMNYVKKHDFKVFGWYRILLGLVVLAYFFGVKPMLA